MLTITHIGSHCGVLGRDGHIYTVDAESGLNGQKSGKVVKINLENCTYTYPVHNLKFLSSDKKSKSMDIVTTGVIKKKMIKEMRKSAVEWGAKIRRGRPSQEEAWQALHSTIAAKLKYPLAACTFRERECIQVMVPCYQSSFPQIWYITYNDLQRTRRPNYEWRPWRSKFV